MIKRYSVGTHKNIISFDCLECSERYYFDLQEEKKYLKDNEKNIYLK